MNEQPYAIAWSSSGRRALRRVPEKVGTAAVEFLYGSVADNPYRISKPLQLDFEGLHSARRGDYRIIYSIDDAERIVTVVTIEHRADAYRPRHR